MRRRGVSVFVDRRHAGALTRSDLEPDTYLFSYGSDCAPERAVSLTMPVVPDQYDSMGALHPVFEMNLPEGMLRARLELMFSKLVPDFDALTLLELVGSSQIGRLRYAAEGDPLDEVPSANVEEILTYRGAEDLFADLVERFARYSGVSGVQPKVLIRDGARAFDRFTGKGATHIVKSFDPREYPELAANEFFCMRAARHAGLPAAKVRLSGNRAILVVERFDRKEDGSYLGFEDFCVLSGLRTSGRYRGSYEDLARKVRVFVSPEHQAAAMRQLFGTVALSCLIRNGDAHLKNFGVLYDAPEQNVRLAPVYDMLSTAPYLPNDVLALELNGSKQYPSRSQLVQFGRNACGLSRQVSESILREVAKGIRQAVAEIESYAREHPDFRKTADYLSRLFISNAPDELHDRP
jgi:serine/threonine-protein kinase HipA